MQQPVINRLHVPETSTSEEESEKESESAASSNSGKRLFEMNMLKFYGTKRVNTMK